MLATLGLTVAAGELSSSRARERLARDAAATARLHAAVLRTQMQKYRPIPFVLSRDPDVIAALNGQRSATDDPFLNRKLAALGDETRARPIYVQNAAGVIVATSNWQSPHSILNCRCGAPQFDAGLNATSMEYFAKGRSPGGPGLYITHSIKQDGRPLGLVAAKVELGEIEREWQANHQTVLVTDPDGVVLISSVAGWRYKTLAPLSPAVRRKVVESGRYQGEALGPLPAKLDAGSGEAKLALRGRGAQPYLVSAVPVEPSGLVLRLLTPESGLVRDARLSGNLSGALAGLLLSAAAVFALRRREARQVAAEREHDAREWLEARVALRTRELSDANGSLVREIEQRRQVERELHHVQEEMVQANKLATLGQIATGVAHEINQPVSAISVYAQNSTLLLERGDTATVASNLEVIGGLTERISVITGELRAFARRSPLRLGPVAVTTAVDGARLLLSYRLTAAKAVLSVKGARPGLTAIAERVRLEQILVNLLQNALDALADQADRRIEISVREAGDQVIVRVEDNGPGLSPEITDALFMPFATTKPKGLGLGLVISRDLARELGGDLRTAPSAVGAAFELSLKRA